MQKTGGFKELESQIYNLNFTEKNYIDNCKVVFLIPEDADGTEKYFVYYDDSEKNDPEYKDHLDISEEYYKYEPIRGFYYENWFYKISQGEDIAYVITKKGKFINSEVSQQVTKFKNGKNEYYPKNTEHITSFCFSMWLYNNDDYEFISTNYELVSADILVDGNLMVECIIKSKSKSGILETTNIYRYYYCPTENRRLEVSVNHKVLEKLPYYDRIEVSFGLINKGSIRSNIEELNSGEIPPYLHFYSENDRVLSYNLDTDPQGITWQEILTYEEDYDLGELAWLSLDYGKSGNAHGVIFDSNNFIKKASDETDGLQLVLYESNTVNLPNLNGKFAYLYFLRNEYEKDTGFDKKISEEYEIEFNAEIYSTTNGGYPEVEKESAIYHTKMIYQKNNNKGQGKKEEDIEKYSLTIYTDIPSSLYAKVYSSLIAFKLPRLYAELYKNDTLLAISRVGRFLFTEEIFIDWKNTSIFNKAIFTNLPEGKYLVKVYIDNLAFKKSKIFIGYKVIDLKEDTVTAVNCRKQGNIVLNFYDQNGNGIENIKTRLFEEGTVIESINSDSEGYSSIGFPCGIFRFYSLESYYKGFLVDKQDIDLGVLSNIIPYKIQKEINLYSLNVNFSKENSDISSINPDIYLTSDNMEEPRKLYPNKISDTNFRFEKLISNDYILNIKYNNFRIEEEINISENISVDLDIYDLNINVFDAWVLPIEATVDISLSSKSFRENLNLTGHKEKNYFYKFNNLYPGKYKLSIVYRDFLQEKTIIIPENKNNISISFDSLFNLSLDIFDSQGNPLSDAKINISRKNKSLIDTTNENGECIFSIPPGEYTLSIFSDEELISNKKLSVLSDKNNEIISREEPDYKMTVIILLSILCFIFFLVSYKKKDFILFLKIFIISLIVISISLSFWSLENQDSTSELKTKTDMYIYPSELISFKEENGFFYGEFSSINEEFDEVVDFVPVLLFISIFLVSLSIFIKFLSYKKIAFTCMAVSLILLVLSIILFYYTMSEYANVFVKSFIGSGDILVNSPLDNEFITLNARWGPSYGFYINIAAAVLMFILIAFSLNKFLKTRYRIITLKVNK